MFKFFLKIKEYLLQAKSEFFKINWIPLREAIRYTFLVIFISFLAAIFLGSVDFVFLKILEIIIP